MSHYELDSNGQLRVIGDYENWKTINSIVIEPDSNEHSVYVNPVSLEYFSEHKMWKDETIMIKKSNKENVALEVFVRSKKNFPNNLDHWEIFEIKENESSINSFTSYRESTSRCAECHDHPLVGPNDL